MAMTNSCTARKGNKRFAIGDRAARETLDITQLRYLTRK